MQQIINHFKSIIGKIPKHRLLSLDVFRGLTITAMVLVNNPGSWSHIYSPLKHAQWHGWTPTDLIFPFFVFIVGVSICLSIEVQKRNGLSNSHIIKSSFIRTSKLVLLGWFLALFYYQIGNVQFNWIDDRLFAMRIMGVLQRIGIVYFICVLIYLMLKTRVQLWLFAGLMVIYILLMNFIPYSDTAGTVYQGFWLHGNSLAAWLDNLVLGSKHLYYKDAIPFSFDPEGILSTLPAISTCLSGILLGKYLRFAKRNRTELSKQIVYIAAIGLGMVVFAELWSNWLPINKALWTPSFVLLSSGYACLVLALCMYLIDLKGYRNWCAPFVVFGANSIAFYMFSGVMARIIIMIPVADSSLKAWLYQSVYAPIFGALNGSLAFAITFLIISYVVMYGMYRKNIIWKV